MFQKVQKQASKMPPDAADSLLNYFEKQLPQLLRPAQGVLRHPYLNPGGTYLDQLWDWDSFWVAKGLLDLADLAEDRSMKAKVLEHARGSLLNFFEHQGVNGCLPILLRPDDPDVFNCLTESDFPANPAKPVFAQFALRVLAEEDQADWLPPMLPKLEKFYQRWESQHLTETGLFVWASDVAIGVDNDPTTYGRPFFSSANLLLNTMLFQDFLAAEKLAESLGSSAAFSAMHHRRTKLGKAIAKHCWDEEDEFFYTVDVQCTDHRDVLIPEDVPKGMSMSWQVLPLKIKLFTGFLPMWSGLASQSQAERIVARYFKPGYFLGQHGFRTLSKREPYYDPMTNSGNPSNWLGPTWTIASYLVWSGLRRYGFTHEANHLARLQCDLFLQDLRRSGSLHEHYNPETGEPNFNRDFISWNLLIIEMVKTLTVKMTADTENLK